MGWMRIQQWEWTALYNKTNESYKHNIENFIYERACTIWIYVHNIQKQAKLMHDAGSQDIGYLKGFMIGERS